MSRDGGRSAIEVLEVALAHLDIAQQHGALDLDSLVVTDGIALRLSAAVDALSQLEPTLRDSIAQGRWDQMRGMRNRIAHGYGSVSPAIVRTTVENELGPLTERVQALLAELERG